MGAGPQIDRQSAHPEQAFPVVGDELHHDSVRSHAVR